MAGRETTVASIPSDNATFDGEPGAAKPVLHRDIEAHLPNLRRYARSLTRDAVAADDLVQECETEQDLASGRALPAAEILRQQRQCQIASSIRRSDRSGGRTRPPSRPCRFSTDRFADATLTHSLYPITLREGKSPADDAAVGCAMLGMSPVISRVLG
jgi:Sigma-70 region 2